MFVRGKEEKGILGTKIAENACLFWLLEKRRRGGHFVKVSGNMSPFNFYKWQRDIMRKDKSLK